MIGKHWALHFCWSMTLCLTVCCMLYVCELAVGSSTCKCLLHAAACCTRLAADARHHLQGWEHVCVPCRAHCAQRLFCMRFAALLECGCPGLWCRALTLLDPTPHCVRLCVCHTTTEYRSTTRFVASNTEPWWLHMHARIHRIVVGHTCPAQVGRARCNGASSAAVGHSSTGMQLY